MIVIQVDPQDHEQPIQEQPLHEEQVHIELTIKDTQNTDVELRRSSREKKVCNS